MNLLPCIDGPYQGRYVACERDSFEITVLGDISKLDDAQTVPIEHVIYTRRFFSVGATQPEFECWSTQPYVGGQFTANVWAWLLDCSARRMRTSTTEMVP